MSTVIKKGETGKLVRQLVSFDLADHLANAQKVIDAAQRQAEKIAAEAKHRSSQLRIAAQKEAYALGHGKGYADGVEAGTAEGLAKATESFEHNQSSLTNSLAKIIEEWEQQKRDLLISARRDLLEFAVALASKITRSVGELNGDSVLANVEQALRLVGDKTDVTIHMHPSDAETLRRFADGLARDVEGQQHIALVEDDGVAPGGAMISTGEMEVDARIETQIEQITSVLLGSMPPGRNRDVQAADAKPGEEEQGDRA